MQGHGHRMDREEHRGHHALENATPVIEAKAEGAEANGVALGDEPGGAESHAIEVKDRERVLDPDPARGVGREGETDRRRIAVVHERAGPAAGDVRAVTVAETAGRATRARIAEGISRDMRPPGAGGERERSPANRGSMTTRRRWRPGILTGAWDRATSAAGPGTIDSPPTAAGFGGGGS